MKKLIALLLTATLLAACGCGGKNTEVVDVLASSGTEVTAAPEDGVVSAPAAGEAAPDPAAADPAGAAPAAVGIAYEVVSSVAYVFEGAEGPTLYGAIEYRNTGDTPISVSSATFDFSAGGTPVTETFTPILREFDIVGPGQTSYLAVWKPDSTLTPGDAASITSAQLMCEAATATRSGLTVSDIYLADNYPGFTTLSGRIKNASTESFDFSVVYAGFHDASGALLGVWYFTKNVSLEPGDEKPFVVQMTELPIPDLASLAASSDGTGFGFD